MRKELQQEATLQEVAHTVARNFGTVFHTQVLWLETLDSLLDQKDLPLNLLQAQVNCAATIRKLYENREFLHWKLFRT